MLKLKTLEITNFISVKYERTQLDNLGLCLVHGNNGTGKSNTYKKALTWVLFGQVPEKLSVSDISPESGSKATSVILELETNDKVRIERYRNHPDYDNKLRLIINENDVSKTDNRETQKDINTLLGVDYTTFTNSTVFSTGIPLFADSGAAGRAELLSNIKQLSIYSDALAKVKENHSDISDKYSKTITRIEWLEESIDRYNKAIEEEKVREQKQALEKEQRVKILREQIELEKSLLGAQSNVIEYSIKGLEETIENKDKEIHERLGKVAELQRDLIRIGMEKSSINEVIYNLDKNKVCPSCLQEITPEHIEIERSKLGKKSAKLKLLEEQTEVPYKSLLDIDKTEKELLYNLKLELKKLNRELAGTVKIENNIKVLEKELETVLNNAVQTVSSLKLNIKECIQELEALNKVLPDYSFELKRLDFWKEGFSRNGIPNLIIEKSIPELEYYVNSYLSSSGLSVNITSRKELKSSKELKEEIDFTINIDSNTRTYNQLSSGEKKRIDIAFLFALMDLSSNKFNILVLDEIFDLSLDSKGCELVIEILNKKIKEVDSIIVITHKEELKEYFNNIITMG